MANERAIANGRAELGPVDADAAVRLTRLGELQARALGLYLQHASRPPQCIVTSPFQRCRATARIAAAELGLPERAIATDERLRERNLGILDRLTPLGIRERYPHEAARRAAVGKYVYRPPKGESWMDVADRVRDACDELFARYGGEDVAVVTHQAVLLCMRYVLEGLTVAQLHAIDTQSEIKNCGVTTYTDVSGTLHMVSYNVDPTLVETPHD